MSVRADAYLRRHRMGEQERTHPCDADLGQISTPRFEQAVQEGHNPFGLAKDMTPGGIKVRLVDALLGTDRPLRDRLEVAARNHLAGDDEGLEGPDAITADMVAHYGFDPLAYAIIGTINGAYDARQGSGGIAYAVHGPIHKLKMPGFEWHSDGSIMVGRLPATLGLVSSLRPLRDLLTHPVLDRYALLMTDVEIDAAPTMSRIRIIHDRSPVDVERLIVGRLPRTDANA